MVAQASHIPVHLGSTHLTAGLLLKEVAMKPKDVILLNDPWRGGTHLPDITAFAPVFFPGDKKPSFGVLVRAHHADVGGASPGSMGNAYDVYGEGLVIPPVRLVREGVWDPDVTAIVLGNTRTPHERMGDLRAQVASVNHGIERLLELGTLHGARVLLNAAQALEAHAKEATEALLRSVADGEGKSELEMDLPERPTIRVHVKKVGARLFVDFAGTDAAVHASYNANEAITLSCVFYVIRLLLDESLPTNSGCLAPITVSIPKGSFLNAPRPFPVAGGNVETSQAVVEALLIALSAILPDRIPAASQGTMNNVTVGGQRSDGTPWTFYETLGGGVGAGALGAGASGLQSHMTNTMNTPVEALENAFPIRITAYHLRERSGGDGLHRGGDGLVREFQFLEPCKVTILAGRRQSKPPGVAGGEPGQSGRDRMWVNGRWVVLKSAGTIQAEPGQRLRMETPGGGGFRRVRAKPKPKPAT
jgi:N-methylhydantoinase B